MSLSTFRRITQSPEWAESNLEDQLDVLSGAFTSEIEATQDDKAKERLYKDYVESRKVLASNKVQDRLGEDPDAALKLGAFEVLRNTEKDLTPSKADAMGATHVRRNLDPAAAVRQIEAVEVLSGQKFGSEQLLADLKTKGPDALDDQSLVTVLGSPTFQSARQKALQDNADVAAYYSMAEDDASSEFKPWGVSQANPNGLAQIRKKPIPGASYEMKFPDGSVKDFTFGTDAKTRRNLSLGETAANVAAEMVSSVPRGIARAFSDSDQPEPTLQERIDLAQARGLEESTPGAFSPLQTPKPTVSQVAKFLGENSDKLPGKTQRDFEEAYGSYDTGATYDVLIGAPIRGGIGQMIEGISGAVDFLRREGGGTEDSMAADFSRGGREVNRQINRWLAPQRAEAGVVGKSLSTITEAGSGLLADIAVSKGFGRAAKGLGALATTEASVAKAGFAASASTKVLGSTYTQAFDAQIKSGKSLKEAHDLAGAEATTVALTTALLERYGAAEFFVKPAQAVALRGYAKRILAGGAVEGLGEEVPQAAAELIVRDILRDDSSLDKETENLRRAFAGDAEGFKKSEVLQGLIGGFGAGAGVTALRGRGNAATGATAPDTGMGALQGQPGVLGLDGQPIPMTPNTASLTDEEVKRQANVALAAEAAKRAPKVTQGQDLRDRLAQPIDLNIPETGAPAIGQRTGAPTTEVGDRLRKPAAAGQSDTEAATAPAEAATAPAEAAPAEAAPAPSLPYDQIVNTQTPAETGTNANEERPTRHRVFPGGSPVAVKPGEGVLDARDPSLAYRITGQPQIDDMAASGQVRAKIGKMRGGRTGETQWSAGDPSLGYKAESNEGKYVVVAANENLNDREGGLPNSEVRKVYKSNGETWVDVTDQVVRKDAEPAPTAVQEQVASTNADEAVVSQAVAEDEKLVDEEVQAKEQVVAENDEALAFLEEEVAQRVRDQEMADEFGRFAEEDAANAARDQQMADEQGVPAEEDAAQAAIDALRAEREAPPTINRVFEYPSTPAPITEPNLPATDETSAYRAMTEEEIQDFRQNGKMRSGATRGGTSNTVQWVKGGTNVGYPTAANKGKYVAVTSVQNLKGRLKPIFKREVTKIYQSDGTQWVDVTEKVKGPVDKVLTKEERIRRNADQARKNAKLQMRADNQVVAAFKNSEVGKFISGFGKLISWSNVRNTAEGARSSNLWNGAKNLKRSPGILAQIFGGETRPDIMADAMFEANIISQNTPDAMWSAVSSAIGSASIEAEKALRQQEVEELNEEFLTLASEGDVEVTFDELAKGDTLIVSGREFTVARAFPGGVSLVGDGKFATPITLYTGQIESILVDEVFRGNSAAPAAPAAPATPATPAARETAVEQRARQRAAEAKALFDKRQQEKAAMAERAKAEAEAKAKAEAAPPLQLESVTEEQLKAEKKAAADKAKLKEKAAAPMKGEMGDTTASLFGAAESDTPLFDARRDTPKAETAPESEPLTETDTRTKEQKVAALLKQVPRLVAAITKGANTLVQDAVNEAITKQINKDPDTPEAVLRTIGKRAASTGGVKRVGERRARKAGNVGTLDTGMAVADEAPTPDQAAAESDEQIDRMAQVRDAMMQLSESERAVMTLELQGQSVEQIAKKLGISKSTVTTLKSRALKKLRKAIESAGTVVNETPVDPPKPWNPSLGTDQQLLNNLLVKFSKEYGAAPTKGLKVSSVMKTGKMTKMQRTVVELGRFFGRRVIFVSGSPLDAFTDRAAPSVIYIADDSTRPAIHLFYHELLHTLRASDPKAYAKFEKAVSADLDAYVAAYKERKEQTQDLTKEEFMADFLADRANDPEFWEKLSKKNRTLFEKIVELLHNLFRSVQDSGMGTAQWVADLQKADKAAIEALLTLRLQEATREGQDGDGIRASRRPMDAAYMAAVEAGDMETAQAMVDEAARAAGYNVKAYHGGADVTEFNVFPMFLSPYKKVAQSYAEDREVNLGKAKLHTAFIKAENPAHDAQVLSAAKRQGIEAMFGDGTPPHVFLSPNMVGEEEAQRVALQLKDDGFDSAHTDGDYSMESDFTEYDSWTIFDANQIKSADPVTYDDNGDVIPLSQRFNPTSNDIRASRRPMDADTARFNELTADLYAGNPEPTAEDIAAWRKANPEKWSELSKLREQALRAAGYGVKAYHGTTKKFTKFVESYAPGWGKGVYFADSLDSTGEFGNIKVTAYLKLANPIRSLTADVEKKLRDTSVVKNRQAKERKEYDDDEHIVDLDEAFQEDIALINDAAREAGYDGFIGDRSNNIEGNEYVVFSPSQIKSADPISPGPKVTPDQWADSGSNDIRASRRPMDAAYMAAVEAGDMETAQRMVDEAAREAGYTVKAYHGTDAKNIKVFQTGATHTGKAHFSDKQEVAAKFASSFDGKSQGRVYAVFLANDVESRPGFDFGTEFTEYLVPNPSQIKSADPVTYDEAGNVIPLSQRFNSASNDIRASRRPIQTAGGENRFFDRPPSSQKVLEETVSLVFDPAQAPLTTDGLRSATQFLGKLLDRSYVEGLKAQAVRNGVPLEEAALVAGVGRSAVVDYAVRLAAVDPKSADKLLAKVDQTALDLVFLFDGTVTASLLGKALRSLRSFAGGSVQALYAIARMGRKEFAKEKYGDTAEEADAAIKAADLTSEEAADLADQIALELDPETKKRVEEAEKAARDAWVRVLSLIERFYKPKSASSSIRPSRRPDDTVEPDDAFNKFKALVEQGDASLEDIAAAFENFIPLVEADLEAAERVAIQRARTRTRESTDTRENATGTTRTANQVDILAKRRIGTVNRAPKENEAELAKRRQAFKDLVSEPMGRDEFLAAYIGLGGTPEVGAELYDANRKLLSAGKTQAEKDADKKAGEARKSMGDLVDSLINQVLFRAKEGQRPTTENDTPLKAMRRHSNPSSTSSSESLTNELRGFTNAEGTRMFTDDQIATLVTAADLARIQKTRAREARAKAKAENQMAERTEAQKAEAERDAQVAERRAKLEEEKVADLVDGLLGDILNPKKRESARPTADNDTPKKVIARFKDLSIAATKDSLATELRSFKDANGNQLLSEADIDTLVTAAVLARKEAASAATAKLEAQYEKKTELDKRMAERKVKEAEERAAKAEAALQERVDSFNQRLMEARKPQPARPTADNDTPWKLVSRVTKTSHVRVDSDVLAQMLRDFKKPDGTQLLNEAQIAQLVEAAKLTRQANEAADAIKAEADYKKAERRDAERAAKRDAARGEGLFNVRKRQTKDPSNRSIKQIILEDFINNPSRKIQTREERIEFAEEILREKTDLPEAEIKRIALKMEGQLAKMLEEAKFKAAQPFLKSLGQKALSREQIHQVIRLGILDPSADFISSISALAGWDGLSPQDYRKLAELQAQIDKAGVGSRVDTRNLYLQQRIIENSVGLLPKFKDLMNSYVRANIFSAITSQTIGITVGVWETMMTGLTEALYTVGTKGKNPLDMVLEVGAIIRAFGVNLPRALRESLEVLKTGTTYIDQVKQDQDRLDNKEPSSFVDPLVRTYDDAMKKMEQALVTFKESPSKRAAQVLWQALRGWIFAAGRFTFRGLYAADAAVTKLNSTAMADIFAYRETKRLGITKEQVAAVQREVDRMVESHRMFLETEAGISGNLLEIEIRDKIQGLFLQAISERGGQGLDTILTDAASDIQDRIGTGLTSKVTITGRVNEAASTFVNNFPLPIGGLLPAIRTTGNVIDSALWYSPIGLIRAMYYNGKTVEERQAAFPNIRSDWQFRRKQMMAALTNGATMAMFALLMANQDEPDDEKFFWYTGTYPVMDKAEQARWDRNGWSEYTLIVGDLRIQVNRGFGQTLYPSLTLASLLVDATDGMTAKEALRNTIGLAEQIIPGFSQVRDRAKAGDSTYSAGALVENQLATLIPLSGLLQAPRRLGPQIDRRNSEAAWYQANPFWVDTSADGVVVMKNVLGEPLESESNPYAWVKKVGIPIQLQPSNKNRDPLKKQISDDFYANKYYGSKPTLDDFKEKYGETVTPMQYKAWLERRVEKFVPDYTDRRDKILERPDSYGNRVGDVWSRAGDRAARELGLERERKK